MGQGALRGNRLRAGLRGLRRLHQDGDDLVWPGDAGNCDAARRTAFQRLRSVSRHRLVAGGVAGGGLSTGGQAQRRPAYHHQPRSNRFRRYRRSRRPCRYRTNARNVHHPLIAYIHGESRYIKHAAPPLCRPPPPSRGVPKCPVPCIKQRKNVVFDAVENGMLTRKFAKRPDGAPEMRVTHVLMTTDTIRPKGPGTTFVLESDSLDNLMGDAGASVIEIAGVIKWFDASKGFGFIVPDNGMADVLLHVTCLRRDGFQTAHEGARIVVEAVQRPKGLQAFRVLSMDESTAVHRRRCQHRVPM